MKALGLLALALIAGAPGRQSDGGNDARLPEPVDIACKHASFAEICAEIQRQTGIAMSAGRNVADDNATIFAKRPLREVMREISRVFGFIWERHASGGVFAYTLKQDTAAAVAEEKLRNDDVSKSIEALSRKMLAASDQKTGDVPVPQSVFQNLSIEELETLRSGREIRFASPGYGDHPDGMLDPVVTKQLLHSAYVYEVEKGLYLSGIGTSNDPSRVYYDEMTDTGASVSLKLKISEFGGAGLSGEYSVSGKGPNKAGAGLGWHFDIGTVPGPAEAPPHNGRDNQALESSPGFDKLMDVEPKPSTPLGEQGVDPPAHMSGSLTEVQGSYRTWPKLQPPRPFMNSDDFWEAIHEKTGRDIVADSFSRLFRFKKYRGSLFAVLCQGADNTFTHWGFDHGFLTGRSAAYQWQRLTEVPKHDLLRWRADRKRNGWLPLVDVLEMSQLSDRQLDSWEVGKTIANQWKLPEWGVPSRPHMQPERNDARFICRFLARLRPEQLDEAVQGTLPLKDVSFDALDALGPILKARIENDGPKNLRVDYIPAGKYYWQPFFEQGKEQVFDDLVFSDTADDVMEEVVRLHPNLVQSQTAFSDGLIGIIDAGPVPDSPRPFLQIGDTHFLVGHRLGQ